jgi:hypothetical protein
MSSFNQRIAKYSYILESEKAQFKQSSDKVSYLRFLSSEVDSSFKLLINGYKNYGKRHKSEFESLEDYRKTLDTQTGLSKILISVSSYTRLIGDFYTTQCDEKLEMIQTKQTEFDFEIENFNLSAKLKTFKNIEEISKALAEIQEIDKKLEELRRQKEEIKIFLENLQVGQVKADQKLEKNFLETEAGINQDISSLSLKAEKVEKVILCKIQTLKEEFLEFSLKSLEIENKCVECFIAYLSGLLVKLLEFRKSTSEVLNSALETISMQDSKVRTVSSPRTEEEMLRISNQKIQILNKIKEILIKIAESESSIPYEFLKHVKKSKVFTPTTEISMNLVKHLEDIQEIIKIQQNSAEEIHASIVKPIETMIRIQTSLNSSLHLSIRNISKNFEKATEHYLNSPNRQSLPHSSKIENIPVKVLQFKENHSKQINSLLVDHVNKENSYLSSIKNTLFLIHEKHSKVFDEVNELLSNSNVSFKSQNAMNSSMMDLSEIDKKFDNNLAVLRKNGRNHFRTDLVREENSDDEEFRKRFDRNNKEPVVASFLCAYLDTILLQGKMYITPSFIAFYSHFNSSTILGKETVLKIPIDSIEKMNKVKIIFIFDTSLAIYAGGKEFFFTSFISRDEAFHILLKLWNLHEKQVQRLHNPVSLFLEVRIPRLKISTSLKTVSDPFSSMFPNSNFSVDVFDPVLEINSPIQKVYQSLYSSQSSEFNKSYLESLGDELVEITDWSLPPPDFFQDSEGKTWRWTATRTIKNRHKLKERLPLMPTHCLLIESQTIYFFSQEKFVIEAEFEVDAPYGEYFTTYVRTTVEAEGVKTKISLKYGMVFHSYTIFQSKILREGTKETLETFNNHWKPMVIRRLENNPVVLDIPPVVIQPVVDENKHSKLHLVLWAIVILLVLVILKLWAKVRSLELELSGLRH